MKKDPQTDVEMMIIFSHKNTETIAHKTDIGKIDKESIICG